MRFAGDVIPLERNGLWPSEPNGRHSMNHENRYKGWFDLWGIGMVRDPTHHMRQGSNNQAEDFDIDRRHLLDHKSIFSVDFFAGTHLGS